MASGLGFVHMALRVVFPPGSTSAQKAGQLEIGELIGKYGHGKDDRCVRQVTKVDTSRATIKLSLGFPAMDVRDTLTNEVIGGRHQTSGGRALVALRPR